MNGIEIVTHCYASELPQFAVFLRWQVSSLIHHTPHVDTQLTVCYTPTDMRTASVLRWAGPLLGEFGVRLKTIQQKHGELGRRSIGRNLAAKATEADLVWFTDVDHYFGSGCLDGLWGIYLDCRKIPAMFWPKTIQIHVDHQLGDAQWTAAEQSEGLLPAVDPAHFMPKHYGRAIGGVQIVNGAFCRALGYLAGSKRYQQPRDDGKLFGDFKDDVAFRRECERMGGLQGIELPNLYRMRHTATTYQD